MLILFGLVLLFFVALSIFLAAGTLFFQAYVYSEPTEGIHWRAPASAGVLAVFLLFWVFLAHRAPGTFGTLFEFSPREDVSFTELQITAPDGKTEVYKQITLPDGRKEFRLHGRGTGKRFPSRPAKIVALEEGGEKVVFEPRRDAQGNFATGVGEYLEYEDSKGRVMVEGAWGQASIFRTGIFLANLLINLVFFSLWMVVLWLFLNYQLWHAVGLGFCLWLVAILFIIPPLLSRAEREAAPARPSSVAPLSSPA